MSMNVIIINGTGGVGKDTLISMFKMLHQNAYASYIQAIHCMVPVKEAAAKMGWDGSKSDENRKALSDLKKFSDSIWDTSYKYIMGMHERIKSPDTPSCQWLFIQCREPENIKRLVDSIPSAKTVLITRDGIGNHGNDSDDNVNNYEYDLIFANDSNIMEAGRDFAFELYKLFDLDATMEANFEENLGFIKTNIIGRTFTGDTFGHGDITIVKVHYGYLITKAGWVSDCNIHAVTRKGELIVIPFTNPDHVSWTKIVDVDNGKSIKDYYDEQSWDIAAEMKLREGIMKNED